jgi:hypothetical protein
MIMRTTLTINRSKIRNSVLIDGLALAFIYFIPSLAHLVSLPVYMIEPMRVMLILSLAHSSKWNSYLLALTLPLFSYLVSGHPFFGKMVIITAELVVNVFLFYFLFSRLGKFFWSAFLSIVLSKLLAYLLYLVFFSFAFVIEESEVVFLSVQVLTTLIFSGYILFTRSSQIKSTNP